MKFLSKKACKYAKQVVASVLWLQHAPHNDEENNMNDKTTEWPTFRGRYAHCSRGKHYAKHVATGRWARRPDNSLEDVLVLDEPGKWFVGSKDGFSRKESRYVMVSENGELVD